MNIAKFCLVNKYWIYEPKPVFPSNLWFFLWEESSSCQSVRQPKGIPWFITRRDIYYFMDNFIINSFAISNYEKSIVSDGILHILMYMGGSMMVSSLLFSYCKLCNFVRIIHGIWTLIMRFVCVVVRTLESWFTKYWRSARVIFASQVVFVWGYRNLGKNVNKNGASYFATLLKLKIIAIRLVLA